jgi:hypothetical protein
MRLDHERIEAAVAVAETEIVGGKDALLTEHEGSSRRELLVRGNSVFVCSRID